ncbi:hypothetical protein [Endozoicomonas sp.]|uniref:hypothetical protein n=1 Tax=Endozoicomonas sp. TaxID=1892382 RepID=UPI003AF9D5EF
MMDSESLEGHLSWTTTFEPMSEERYRQSLYEERAAATPHYSQLSQLMDFLLGFSEREWTAAEAFYTDLQAKAQRAFDKIQQGGAVSGEQFAREMEKFRSRLGLGEGSTIRLIKDQVEHHFTVSEFTYRGREFVLDVNGRNTVGRSFDIVVMPRDEWLVEAIKYSDSGSIGIRKGIHGRDYFEKTGYTQFQIDGEELKQVGKAKGKAKNIVTIQHPSYKSGIF